MEDKIPFELWLKILSYLPQVYQRKMIGVCRSLFEYALDDVFRELNLGLDDERTLFMTNRLHNAAVAKRVTRLKIQTTFLLDTTPPRPTEGESRSPQNGKNKFLRFLKPNQPKANQSPEIESQIDAPDTLWTYAERNIKLCINIVDLVIILDAKGSQLPRTFESFFCSIWHPESILPRIQTLTIDGTAHNLSKLIFPMCRFSSSWTSLERVDITIDPSHKSVINFAFLPPFLDGLKDKLTHLTLSGQFFPNVGNIMMFSPVFTKLKNFELHSIMNVLNLEQIDPLNAFLTRQSETLESVVINPQVRLGPKYDRSRPLYIYWLALNNGMPAQEQSFSRISLPRLRTLELRYDNQWIDGPIHYDHVFPSFYKLSPNLTALTVSHAELALNRIAELLSLLPRCQTENNGVCPIEYLDLSIDILSPELMDLLTESLPRLHTLKLRLSRYIVASDLEQYMFYQIIRTRKYSSWKLGNLSIVAASSRCGVPHPNMQAMRAVAESLSNPPTLDMQYECQCNM